METQIFDWEEWDGDSECMIFYNCTMKVDIGGYASIGDKFDCIQIDNVKGVMSIQNGGESEFSFKLVLSVGERID